VFPNPDTFDVGRTPNPHLAFSTGTHYCLGVNLAKLEGNAVFRVLFVTSMPVRVR
jgi:cholest-4-en-3-one 26-monooxygenase